MDRRAMGVTVDQLPYPMLAHGRDYGLLIDVHDRLCLVSAPLAASVAILVGHADALFHGQGEKLSLSFVTAQMGT